MKNDYPYLNCNEFMKKGKGNPSRKPKPKKKKKKLKVENPQQKTRRSPFVEGLSGGSCGGRRDVAVLSRRLFRWERKEERKGGREVGRKEGRKAAYSYPSIRVGVCFGWDWSGRGKEGRGVGGEGLGLWIGDTPTGWGRVASRRGCAGRGVGLVRVVEGVSGWAAAAAAAVAAAAVGAAAAAAAAAAEIVPSGSALSSWSSLRKSQKLQQRRSCSGFYNNAPQGRRCH